MIEFSDVLTQCNRGGVTSASSYVDAHRTVFESAVLLVTRGTAADIATVAQELREIGKLDAVGGFSFLTKIGDRVPTIAQVDYP